LKKTITASDCLLKRLFESVYFTFPEELIDEIVFSPEICYRFNLLGFVA